MAKFSKKMMGKEVGDGAFYAQPHGEANKKVKIVDPNTLTSKQLNDHVGAPRVSIGDPGNTNIKTTGIKIRGTGAATKGVMARGPMC